MALDDRYLLLGCVLFLVLVPGAAADERFIDAQDSTSIGLWFFLWTAVAYLVLAYSASIRTSVRSRAWDTLTTGLVLFVMGLVLFQASVFVVPLHLHAEASAYEPTAMPHVKLSLLFLAAAVLVLFLADWCHVLEIEPRVFISGNLTYMLLALAIAGTGTVLPLVYRPQVPLEPRTFLFPVIAVITFVVVNVYLTISGALLVRTSPAFRRFKWLVADSVFVTGFLLATMYDLWAFPIELRASLLPEVTFYLFSGLFFLVAGYVLKVQALISFTSMFVLAKRRPVTVDDGGEHISAEVLDLLAGKFLKTDELEAAVTKVVQSNQALSGLVLDTESRTFNLSSLDLERENVQAGVSDLFFDLIDLLKELKPPKVDRRYNEEALKKEVLAYVEKAPGRPPPAVEGFILPRSLVLARAVSEVMNTFLGSMPLEAGFTKVVINAVNGVWGGEFVNTETDRITFDGDAFIDFCMNKEKSDKELVHYISRLYLRAHRKALEPFDNVMSRERVARSLREDISQIVKKPIYRAAGVSDVMLNAFFADAHPWGFETINKSTGGVPNKHSVLFVHDTDFPKELFLSRLIAENLEGYRNAVWVSQARHAVTRHLISDSTDTDEHLKEGRLALVAMDPNTDDAVNAGKGCRTIGVTFNKLAFELRQVLDSFPISSIIVIVELPVSALKEDTTMLYKFVFHIKALCDSYDATLILAADTTVCGNETVAMLRGIVEMVAEAGDGIFTTTVIGSGSTVRLIYDDDAGELMFRKQKKESMGPLHRQLATGLAARG